MNKQIMYFGILIVIVASVLSVLAFSIYKPQITPINEIKNNDVNNCFPTYLDNIAPDDLHIRQPSADTLPAGYSLKAVKTELDGKQVALYYSSKSLCPFPRITEGLLPDSTVLVIISAAGGDNSAENFANDRIASFKDSVPGIQMLDVGSYKAYGWESFVDHYAPEGSDIFAKRIPSRLGFYNEQDKTEYTIMGLESLAKLKEIAESLA